MQFNNESDKCTNNIAEYDAMLLGLRKFRAIGVQKCILRTDSKVVAGQIEKEFIAREPTLEIYLGLIRKKRIISKDSQYSTSSKTKIVKLMNWPKLQPATPRSHRRIFPSARRCMDQNSPTGAQGHQHYRRGRL
jgi:ribonuclease HI